MRLLVSIVILLSGLLLYVLVTPEPLRLDLFQAFLSVLGLFLATTIAMNLLQEYVLNKFDKEDLGKTIARVVHKKSYERLGVFNVLSRRSQLPTFGDMLSSMSDGEILVVATSLSFVVPQYLQEIQEVLIKGKINFRFVFLDPNSQACIEYGKSVNEEETLKLQIETNLQQVFKIKKRYPSEHGPLKIRLSGSIPHASFVHLFDKKQRKKLYIIHHTDHARQELIH